MKILCRALAAATLAVSLTACEGIFDQVDQHPLVMKEWRLVEINRPSQPATALPRDLQSRHTLRFGTSGDLTAQLDCNRGNANWEAQRPVDGRAPLFISEVASTRALCPSPSYGEEMAAVLPLASSYMVSRDGRTLEIMTRTGVFVFRSY